MKSGGSSALGPQLAGTAISSRRRYTLNWPTLASGQTWLIPNLEVRVVLWMGHPNPVLLQPATKFRVAHSRALLCAWVGSHSPHHQAKRPPHIPHPSGSTSVLLKPSRKTPKPCQPQPPKINPNPNKPNHFHLKDFGMFTMPNSLQ
jgi:hypothetical protein